jgi:putative phage-type endonuclease
MIDMELIKEPILHDVDQRSDEWFALRMGKITGSKYPMVMSGMGAGKTISPTLKKYLLEKACELLTNERLESYSNAAMQWGTDHEEEAIEYYELETLRVVQEVGFYEIGEHIGDSPDGVTEGRAIEIKCPNSTTHLTYMLDNKKLLSAYKWQCYAHMWATGLNKCDLVSYDPRFPEGKKMVIVEIEKDQVEMDLLQTRVYFLVEKIKEFLNA